MDHQSPLSAPRYRVEHHGSELAPLILSLHERERAARTAAVITATRYRLGGRRGWIVVIDQTDGREHEVVHFPLRSD
jgi:hypothetical protein